MATAAEIHTLHRYFIWADRMRAHFHDRLREEGAPPPNEAHLFPHMPYWYAALYEHDRTACAPSSGSAKYVA